MIQDRKDKVEKDLDCKHDGPIREQREIKGLDRCRNTGLETTSESDHTKKKRKKQDEKNLIVYKKARCQTGVESE
jgi:hypothetical protein